MLKNISVNFVATLILLALFFACPFPIYARDSTSYNPKNVPVSVQTGSGVVPIGTIIAWPVSTDPSDAHKWLECNGQSITDSKYQELRTLLGSNNVPNYQGMFLRGQGTQTYSQNNGSTVGVTPTTHISGALGSVQGDATRNLFSYKGCDDKDLRIMYGAYYYYGMTGTETTSSGGDLTGYLLGFDSSRIVPTAIENRPVNKAVRYLIRAVK